MSISQIILLALTIYLVYYWVRKYSISRSLTHYSAGEVKEKLNNNSVLILDVRTDMERKSQFIKGSLHIPAGQLKRRINELENYRNKEIVCHCHSGVRSMNAASLLRKHGFRSANMKGGIAAWNFANRK
jgi:rhodanese-related sulfurtransferase